MNIIFYIYTQSILYYMVIFAPFNGRPSTLANSLAPSWICPYTVVFICVYYYIAQIRPDFRANISLYAVFPLMSALEIGDVQSSFWYELLIKKRKIISILSDKKMFSRQSFRYYMFSLRNELNDVLSVFRIHDDEERI